MIGCRTWVESWLEEQSEKIVMNAEGDIQCDKDVILEESEERGDVILEERRVDEGVSSGVTAVDWLAKEREIKVLNMEKSRRYNKNAVLGREAEEARQQDIEEGEH